MGHIEAYNELAQIQTDLGGDTGVGGEASVVKAAQVSLYKWNAKYCNPREPDYHFITTDVGTYTVKLAFQVDYKLKLIANLICNQFVQLFDEPKGESIVEFSTVKGFDAERVDFVRKNITRKTLTTIGDVVRTTTTVFPPGTLVCVSPYIKSNIIDTIANDLVRQKLNAAYGDAIIGTVVKHDSAESPIAIKVLTKGGLYSINKVSVVIYVEWWQGIVVSKVSDFGSSTRVKEAISQVGNLLKTFPLMLIGVSRQIVAFTSFMPDSDELHFDTITRDNKKGVFTMRLSDSTDLFRVGSEHDGGELVTLGESYANLYKLIDAVVFEDKFDEDAITGCTKGITALFDISLTLRVNLTHRARSLSLLNGNYVHPDSWSAAPASIAYLLPVVPDEVSDDDDAAEEGEGEEEEGEGEDVDEEGAVPVFRRGEEEEVPEEGTSIHEDPIQKKLKASIDKLRRKANKLGMRGDEKSMAKRKEILAQLNDLLHQRELLLYEWTTNGSKPVEPSDPQTVTFTRSTSEALEDSIPTSVQATADPVREFSFRMYPNDVFRPAWEFKLTKVFGLVQNVTGEGTEDEMFDAVFAYHRGPGRDLLTESEDTEKQIDPRLVVPENGFISCKCGDTTINTYYRIPRNLASANILKITKGETVRVVGDMTYAMLDEKIVTYYELEVYLEIQSAKMNHHVVKAVILRLACRKPAVVIRGGGGAAEL